MKRWWFKIQNPSLYQGHGRSKDYFEGWYYKLVHQSGDHAVALIPGVSIKSDTDKHAFIQLMDGTGGKSHYYRFPYKDFQANKDKLEVRIGDNFFSETKIIADLPDIKVDLDIRAITPLATSTFNPGIMGWFSFTPRMECYHGIVSMHHKLHGNINHGSKSWKYDGGTGYIEKDWGTSFPKCWFWTHSNTFDHKEKVSVMASVAHIPWMGSYFIGFIVALQYGDKQIRFATYNGSKWKARLEEDALYLNFKKGNKVLSLKCIKGPSAELISPIGGEMTGKVNESLQAKILLKLEEKGKPILITEGHSAGLEIAGDYDVLLADKWRSR